ncbi:MAG: sugar 3,4-ketoisomerase [Bacteroidia bacterium]
MQNDIQVISFGQIGDAAIGFISVAQTQEKIPFPIRRVYWTYHTPTEIIRGHHAHTKLEQVLVALHGTITIHTEFADGRKQTTLLDLPNKGLYIPPACWRTIEFSKDAVLMAIVSEEYDAAEYIRDYDAFLKSNS